MIEGLRDEKGRRIRKFFASRDDATEWLRDRRPELKNQGRAAMGLTDGQRTDALRALLLLEPFGATLTAAAADYAERRRMLERTVTFEVLKEELLAAKEADGVSSRYLADLKHRMVAFSKEFGDRMVASIETREIDDWLRALRQGPISRNNFRRNLGVAFSYALSRNYCAANPITRTAQAKEVPKAPGILRPVEMAALLNVAPVKMLPTLCLGGFAGLREAEISRLTWADIDLDENVIRIDAGASKTASRRVVPVVPALAAWLGTIAAKSGSVHVDRYHPGLNIARRAALAELTEREVDAPNLREWPHNALRHSFISYRLASVSNAAQVAMEAGHGQAVLHRHYKALVTPTEAKAWFALRPGKGSGKIIPFKKGAA